MRRTGSVAASDPTAQQAAEEYLRAGGDALGAVVCGFFAAAGEAPGVLFGSLGLLLAQVGVGVRAFDGRQRQPGLGARRAKAVDLDAQLPLASRVAAPSGIAALLVALRYGRSAPLGKVMSMGIAQARSVGSERRAEVLDEIQRLGAAALAAPGIARPLLHVGSPSEGGHLSQADLEAIPALDHPALADGALRVAPWRGTGADEAGSEWAEQAQRQQGLCARDAGGGLAALCYDRVESGVAVPELDVLLPLAALPPRRGRPRVPPGQFLPAPTPLEIEVTSADVPVQATIHLAGRAPLRMLADPRTRDTA